VAPQDGIQKSDRFFVPAVISVETDILDMRTEFFDDLIHVCKLLGRGENVIQQPVIALPVFVPGAHEVVRVIQEFRHLVVLLNTLILVSHLVASQVSPG